MAQQRRPIELKFHVTPEEKAIIEKKKAQIGTSCTAAYCRKMALDGYAGCSAKIFIIDLVIRLKKHIQVQ